MFESRSLPERFESDSNPELRIEARFRLGMMLADDCKRYMGGIELLLAVPSACTATAPRIEEISAKYAGIYGTPLTDRQRKAWDWLAPLVDRIVRAYEMPMWNFGIPYR